MFTRLTAHQRSLIESYVRLAKRVHFHGLDQNDLPVISFQDANGVREAFAILRRPRRTGEVLETIRGGTILKEQAVTEPAHPVRWFSDGEQDFIDPDTHELLCTLR